MEDMKFRRNVVRVGVVLIFLYTPFLCYMAYNAFANGERLTQCANGSTSDRTPVINPKM